MFDADFVPVARVLAAAGALQFDPKSRGAATTWRELPAPKSAREIFEIASALDAPDPDPDAVARAVTASWTPGPATEALRPIVAKLLKLAAHHPVAESLDERVEDSVYVMF